MKIKNFAAVLIACLTAVSANAFDCQSYVGKKVTPTSFDAALAMLPMISPKGEFETTIAYEARTAGAVLPTEPLILSGQADRKLWDGKTDTLQYDADAGLLTVHKFFFGLETNHDVAEFTPQVPGINNSYTVQYQLRKRDTPKGQYKGSNAFGASVTVERIDSVVDEVFERGIRYSESEYVGVADNASTLLPVPMTIEIAKLVKATPQSAIVVVPKPPYFARGTINFAPTRQVPFDVNTTFRTIIADIQCAMVLDASNTVRASFETK